MAAVKLRVTDRDVRNVVALLPKAERPKWLQRWRELSGPMVGEDDVEWDLALANKLDAFWESLSERASQVASAGEAAADAVLWRVAALVALGVVGVAVVRSQVGEST